MEGKTYNGWTNYETWAVALWIDNDQGSHQYWREQAGERYHHAADCESVEEGLWSRRAARSKLAQQLKDDFDESSPLAEEANVYSDLLSAAFTDAIGLRARRKTTLTKRVTELKNKQDRLLDVYLAGDIDEGAYQSKSAQFKQGIALAEESLAKHEATTLADSQAALRIFQWTQNAAVVWRGSNNGVKREILETVCLNRQLSDVSLYIPKSKPFDFFIEGPKINNSRGEWI